jgi:PKD repeat protein
MADEPAKEPGKSKGWLKAIIGTIFGLLSGAFVMYLTPLVDKIVKPPVPVANFEQERQGLIVTFVNRSTGGTEGWWDYGDGSALEPYSKQTSVVHEYKQPGIYTAKLTLRNYFGDQNERTVSIQLDAAVNNEPSITQFSAMSMSPDAGTDAYAPATFHLATKVTNADLCVYDFGDDQPMKVVTDLASAPDQMVTYITPGKYTIKVLAVKGKKTVEKRQVVTVKPTPRGMASAVVTVAYQATWVDNKTDIVTVTETFLPTTQGNVQAIDRTILPRQGYSITGAKLRPYNQSVAQNLRLEPGPKNASYRLTGQLVRTGRWLGGKNPPPSLVVQVELTQEKRTQKKLPPFTIQTSLTAPGNAVVTLPPLKPGWVDPTPEVTMQLKDDSRVLWPGPGLPQGAGVQLEGRPPCKLTAAVTGKEIRIDLVEVKPIPSPMAN